MNQSLDLLSIVIPIGIILVALTIHEAAHAWTADRLGDPTARMLGRVSLNPIVHIDPIGTILLPLVSIFSGLPLLGWAKPVPVNLSRFAHPRRDFMLVAAAGPLSNLAQAGIAGLLLAVVPESSRPFGGGLLPTILVIVVTANVFLAVFNLIPVPPLDGGNVLAGLLPPDAARLFDNLRPYGFIILYAMMFTGVLSSLVVPPANFLVRMFLP